PRTTPCRPGGGMHVDDEPTGPASEPTPEPETQPEGSEAVTADEAPVEAQTETPVDEPEVVHTTEGSVTPPPAAAEAPAPTIPVSEVDDPDREHVHPDLRPTTVISLPPTLTLL